MQAVQLISKRPLGFLNILRDIQKSYANSYFILLIMLKQKGALFNGKTGL
jgi:hypothetical protein